MRHCEADGLFGASAGLPLALTFRHSVSSSCCQQRMPSTQLQLATPSL